MLFARGRLARSTVICALLVSACSSEGEKEPVGRAGSAISQGFADEQEPNNTPATATPIPDTGVTRAHIFPAADADYYAIELAAGDRLDAALMTSFGNTTDGHLRVFAPDGTTVVEADDNNGILGQAAPALAGVPIFQTGTHYIQVLHASSDAELRPYDLHHAVRSGAASPEVEPNNTFAMGQVLSGSGWVAGSLSSPSDVDVYIVNVNAGDTLYASLDTNPERDGFELDGYLSVGTQTALLVADDIAEPGFDAEAWFYTAKSTGPIQVVVRGTNAQTYRLSTTVHPATPLSSNCQTYTNGTDVVIPGGPGMVSSTINVPADVRIADVDVTLQYNHDAPTELDFTLIPPHGSEIGIMTDVGSGLPASVDITIDDEAAFQVSQFQNLNGYMATPEIDFRLAWLKGQRAQGTWTLVVRDDFDALSGGTLGSWGLTICAENPEPTCSGNVAMSTVFSTDFEASAAGFTSSGMQNEWARGTPTAAPINTCASGSNCFKTDLGGNYNASSNQDLISAPIDLTNVAPPIRLSWAMKYQMEDAQWDHAYVAVRPASANTGGTRVFQHLAGDMEVDVGSPTTTIREAAGWGVHHADISAFAGQTIEVVFHVDSDEFAGTTYAGLAVDDVRVAGCAPDMGTGGGGGGGGDATGGGGEAAGGGGASGTGGMASGGAGEGGSGGSAQNGGGSSDGGSSADGGSAQGAGGEGASSRGGGGAGEGGGEGGGVDVDDVPNEGCDCRAAAGASAGEGFGLTGLGLLLFGFVRRSRRRAE